MFFLKKIFEKYDLIILGTALMMTFLGMMCYYPFYKDSSFFSKQSISLVLSLIAYIVFSNISIKFYQRKRFVNLLYWLVFGLLLILFLVGSTFSGAKSWISLGFFAFQPTDLAKIVLILFLARYFSRKHLEINKIKHLIISALYMLGYFLLVFVQPDLGSALIIFGIWFFMILVFGVSKKYVFIFVSSLLLIAVLMYNFGLKDYQKKRVDVFIKPGTDILGSGYNIHQANIALGSGGLWGRGVGEGTQNRLEFVPESETDFIFSSYMEEWGFVGGVLYLILMMIFSFRILWFSYTARNNFESILSLGILIYFTTHFIFHLGINLDVLPVTGITLPFMSYGGSHLMIEFLSLGILNAIRKNNLKFNRNDMEKKEFEVIL